MASPEFEAIIPIIRESLDLSNPDASVEDLRAMLTFDVDAMPAPEGVSFEWTSLAEVPTLLVCPEGARDDAALVYLHGGGYVMGSPDSHRALTARLATLLGCPVYSIDYRLAPEHPHPAAVTDSTTAYRALLERGLAPSRLAIAGDSAGGGLTIATLVKLRDDGVPLPAAAVAISPWIDLEGTGESMRRLAGVDPMVRPEGLQRMTKWFIGSGDLRDPYAAPIHADLTGLPPLLVHVGEVETLLDDSVRLDAHARDAGVDCTLKVFPEMVHVFHTFCGVVPEADAACDEVAAFLRPRLAL